MPEPETRSATRYTMQDRGLSYVPYQLAHTVSDAELVVVDSYYPRGLILSHVYSERTPADFQANTSTGTVLNLLRSSKPVRSEWLSGRTSVTCNHWDIDGFLALWSMLHPDLALEHDSLLEAAAMLGDFREFDPDSKTGRQALKLCATLNAIEAAEFCLPFGDLEHATIEYQVAERKFNFFLERFQDVLRDLENMKELWRAEYDTVLRDVDMIRQGPVTIEESSGCAVVTTPRPLHYYALYSHITCGAVLTLYPDSHYAELEYRYETRVGRVDKQTHQRKDLQPLAHMLSSLEGNEHLTWVCDNINEGGPMLRPELDNARLSRSDRYQSPSYRFEHGLISPTSIPLAVVRERCLAFLRSDS